MNPINNGSMNYVQLEDGRWCTRATDGTWSLVPAANSKNNLFPDDASLQADLNVYLDSHNGQFATPDDVKVSNASQNVVNPPEVITPPQPIQPEKPIDN